MVDLEGGGGKLSIMVAVSDQNYESQKKQRATKKRLDFDK